MRASHLTVSVLNHVQLHSRHQMAWGLKSAGALCMSHWVNVPLSVGMDRTSNLEQVRLTHLRPPTKVLT